MSFIPSKVQLDSQFVQDALSKEKWWARVLFWSAAGLLGLIAVFFAALCEWANDIFLRIYEISPYLPFLVCPIGFLLVYVLQENFFKGAGGSGIPQVVAALRSRSPSLRDKILSLRVLVGKVLCTVIALLSGASVGREGPSVHIGASLFNFLGHYGRFSKFERRQGLIIAGAAAGVAAAFNAPLAGIVFAIEELKGSFEERTSGLMLSAVVLAGLIALALVGHYSYFGKIDAALYGTTAIVAVFVVSSFAGLLGGIFSRGLLAYTPQVALFTGSRKWLLPISAGIIIASFGFFSKGLTFGTGYREAAALLAEPLEYSIAFPFLKILATFFSYITGMAGGVFAPSLSIGAGIGNLLAPLFENVQREALLLIGMVSFLSGVVRAPITAFVIVFEMTENHHLLLPLMAAAFISTGVSKLVCKTPLYRGLSEAYLKKPSQA